MARQARRKAGLAAPKAARSARAGAFAGLPDTTPEEIAPEARSRVSLLMAELDKVKDDLLAAQKRVVELEHRVDEDALLPVLNRRGFGRELDRTLAYVARHETDVCLIFIDLDDFKAVNDRHGHAAGDAALMHVTDILLANVRRSDVVARLGGDEFAILLHRADVDAGQLKANQLQSALLSSGVVFEGKEIALSLTTGVTQLRGTDTAETALSRADALMYDGKAERKAAHLPRET